MGLKLLKNELTGMKGVWDYHGNSRPRGVVCLDRSGQS